MRDALALEHARKQLVLFDGHGADQHGLPLFVALFGLAHHSAVFAGFSFIHHVGVVDAGHRLVGGDLDDVQLVDRGELVPFCGSRAGHAGKFIIQTEIVLERDGGQGLGLVSDLHTLLGFNGLVQAFIVAAAEHQAAGEFVHNNDLVVLDHIVDIALHHAVGLDGLVDVVR